MSEEMFKTTLMGGFDKDEVMERIQKMKDEAAEQQLKWKKQIEIPWPGRKQKEPINKGPVTTQVA